MKEEKLNIYKAYKEGPNKYNIRRPKRKIGLNVFRSLCICHHKGRWVVALTEDDWNNRYFKSCDTINRTEALRIIQFLTDYINLVKPTDATTLNASIKVSANRILKSNAELTAIALNEETNK